jgi:iron complex outermembrane receptor protein
MRAGGALTKDIIQGAFGNDPNLNLVSDNLLVLRDGFSNNNQNNTYSTNLDVVGHFNTAGLKHTLLLGGDYYRLDSVLFESNTDNNTLPFSYISANNPVHPGTPSPPFGFNSKTSNRTDQYGLYIQDQIKLPYNVQVMGGIRYQYIHQLSSSQDSNGSNTNTPGTFDAVTPRVGILWQPKSWLSLYANYAENFGANNPDARLWPNRSFLPPTSATQYEGGIKTEFFDGKLRATLAYYDLTKTNVAAGDLTVDPNTRQLRDCGSGPGTCSLALGEVRSRGPELDITGEILPGWNVIATWANTDIIVTKTNAKGDAISGISPGGRLTNVPRNTGNLWSTYNVQGGDFKGLTFGGGATLRDSALIVDSLDGRQTKLPGYATFNLMAGYSRNVGDAKVSVQLNINNLLDKHYFSSLSTGAGNGAAYADFGQPRTFMGSISVQY